MNLKTLAYFVNSVLLIVHEIDSAYWEEWNLFRLPGGSEMFLLLHFPLVGLIMYGLLEVIEESLIGNLIYYIVALGGLFAFGIHTYFLRKGDEKFTKQISKAILYAILVASLAQILIDLIMV